MEILKDTEIIDLALYLKKEKILVISDTHIGYEEALNKQGVFVPRISFKEVVLKLEKILSKTGKLDRIIVNGDIKHEFGKISETEWRHTLRLLDFLSNHCKEVILVKGNHDTILGPIANKRKVKVTNYVKVNDILLIHGDVLVKKELLKSVKTIIIGHEHPAVTIRDAARAEKYKCFLKGRYLRRNLIVMPSFNLLVYGLDVTSVKKFSPFLKQKLDNFEVYVIGDKVYNFGKLKKLS
ncbi:phosphoesterase [Candidatus Woesearchaeota archaeon B3_Woes]|nr:MAG: phosphoesterase [Candidatus Woesearchaeota archaeon B3_Woes]